jgi:hypothetical protein
VLKQGAEFPMRGVFTKKDGAELKSYQIDLSGIKITTIEEPALPQK